MTQSEEMPVAPLFALALAALTPAGAAEEYQVYKEHPRIVLTAARLRLLRRERERGSVRWQQFESLVAGKAPMPEAAFADALYYRVADNREAGGRAVAWALGPGATDLRQMAIVFDWCQELLDEGQSRALAAKLRNGIERTAGETGVPAVRARVLAAVALAGHAPDPSAGVLERVGKGWWEEGIAVELGAGRDPLSRADYYALFEALHVLRDNLDIDLRLSAADFFKEIAVRQLLAYYPASWPAGENEYRIPSSRAAEPDLERAALARAADMAIVAYDSNSPGSQVLQGWLMHDRFQLRGPFGAPYEFLWANPYHPGLSYYHVPLVFHDDRYGRLFVRSSWDENATWLGTVDGEVQTFYDGRLGVLDAKSVRSPVPLTEALVFFATPELRFRARMESQELVFVLGLKPRRKYLVEVDDQEMSEEAADPGGILRITVPHNAETGFRLREAPSYSGT
jgi:hypothetical protein